MLAEHSVMATIAVQDLPTAIAFYQDLLGLQVVDADASAGVATLRGGSSNLILYVSEHARTNQATAATWGLGDAFDRIVRRLEEEGVEFDHYDLPPLRRNGNVHTVADFRAAWFRDPDGNILHINNG